MGGRAGREKFIDLRAEGDPWKRWKRRRKKGQDPRDRGGGNIPID